MSEKKVLKCEYCDKVLKSKAGKVSHEKSCKSNPVNIKAVDEFKNVPKEEQFIVIGKDAVPKESAEKFVKRIIKSIEKEEPKHITLLKSLIDADGNINLTGNTLEQLHSVYVALYNKEINYKCNNQARTMIASLTAYRLERL